jgi:hypothetical protein
MHAFEGEMRDPVGSVRPQMDKRPCSVYSLMYIESVLDCTL